MRVRVLSLIRTHSWPPPLHSTAAPKRNSSVQALSVNDDDEKAGSGCTVWGYGFGFYQELDVAPRQYT